MTFGGTLYLFSAGIAILVALWKRKHTDPGEDPLTWLIAGCSTILFLPVILAVPFAVLWRFLGW